MSHRRARHLNPRDAGVTMALDARWITGGTPASDLTTWQNRGTGGSTFNGTASGGTKPTYETGGQGGNPIVRFASGDYMLSSSVNLAGSYGFGTYATVVCAFVSSTGAGVTQTFMVFPAGGSEYLQLQHYSNNFLNWDNGSYSAPTRCTVSASRLTTPQVLTGLADGTNNKIARNGVTLTTQAINDTLSSGTNQVNVYPTFIGDAFALIVANWSNESLRRRLEQSLALSFKFQWN